ncbi:MAG: MFS transporter, partial [Candidatus Bipolaricaulota bacterium]|nr:MFS transporter [Candidatus Bipolaricaulota bacterium]
AMVGLIVAASTITGIFLKAPAGTISDQIGRRRTLLFGAAVFGLTPFIYLLVSSDWQLLPIRFFHGMATAIYGPVVMAAVAALAGARKGELLAWFSLIKIATNALGGFLAGGLLYLMASGGTPTVWNFHLIYTIIGGVGVVSLSIAVWLIPGMREETREKLRSVREIYRKTVRGLAEVVRSGPVVLTAGMEGVQNMTMGVLHAFLPLYVVESAGLNVALAGVLWTILTGTSVVAKPLMGRISDRYGRRSPIVAGMILCAVPFALISLFSSFWILAGLAILFGLGEAFVTTSTGALVADLARQESLGAAMGVFGTIADTGQALGPIIIGLLLTRIGYLPAFSLLAGFLLAWTALFVRTQRTV